QKLQDGWTRAILRSALRGLLPEPVRTRPDKADLSPNFVRNLLLFERERIESCIRDDVGGLSRYVDLSRLRGSYLRYAARASGWDGLTVWKAVTLALWLEQTGFRS
ncbi:MAG TPA: asparagine synthase-related protein, partial [Armatimonadota bacterium]|nr:asparagine synthase-related protein [Armatimonadota bacterium]